MLDPNAPKPYGVATSFMNVDYDLYEGETASASVRHTLCRGTMVYDRGEILTAPGHGRYVARSVARSAVHGMTLQIDVDVDAVLADLRELHERFGGPDGARRLAWSPDWLAARAWFREKLDGLPVTVEEDPAGNIWVTLPGAGSTDGFVIVGSHIDAVPCGRLARRRAGPPGRLSGVLRALAAAGTPPPVEVRLVDWADEEGARFGRSLLGSSAAAGTLDPDDVRDLRDSEGTRLEDALAACGVDLDARRRRRPAACRVRCAIGGAAHRAGAGAAGHRPPGLRGERDGRRRALPRHVRGPGRARRLDADAPAPRRARRGGDRRAGDPRGRHPPRRRDARSAR